MIGFFLTRKSYGEIALHWMYVYNITEFTDWSQAWTFLGELRTGISPVWALADIFSFRTFGHVDMTGVWLYRGGMVLMYILPMWMFAKERWQVIAAFAAGLICLWATVVIHPGNPQAYDVYMPAMVLIMVKLLQWVQARRGSATVQLLCCLGAGLLLSMVELTRPFVFMFMPIFLVCVWLLLRRFPRRYFLVFLLPILLFSGGWHAKMVLMHGQWNWTNHTGFNFYQSWHDFIGYMEFHEEPRKPGLSPNINTQWHADKSKELTGLLIKSWIKHPWGATKHVMLRGTEFFSVKTELLSANPQHGIFWPYRMVVWGCSALFVLSMATFAWHLLRNRLKGLGQWLANPEVMLLLFTAFNILIFIVAEAREDARFMISVLPYLLCLPGLGWMRRKWRNANPSEASTSPATIP